MNMKFRKKPVVIEAFQMTEERRATNADWPNWMHEAWMLDRFRGLSDDELETLRKATLILEKVAAE